VTLGNNVTTTYAYDPVSRLTTLTHNLAGTANDLTIGTMTYDAASQITAAPRSNSVYSWTGATALNRNYTINGLNQYTAAGTATFSYDTKGNLTSDGTNTFGYSSENSFRRRRVLPAEQGFAELEDERVDECGDVVEAGAWLG